ncbi:hypothetical protein SSX86_007219 [Deinandra increscens subsp. villosa]|uniref:RNA helicase n=1 Tax=Deinandra increscens subsp. villosa TaxID=3103831 RepID=A0AAP0DGC4_9ASTR
MMMKTYGSRKQTVLMFPWLGHGHISPFLELAKKLNNTNLFNIYLCSTPANLISVKKTLKNNSDSDSESSSIRLIELHLPEFPDLPPELHTTNGLPLHLMPVLKQAFDMSSPNFTKILKTLKPDLLIYDMIQSWAPVSASALGIPSVVFVTTSATMAATMFHLYSHHSKGVPFPFPTIYFRTYEYKHVHEILECSANNRKDKDRVMECVAGSSSIVLVKSFKEIEGKYADYLSYLTGKKIVPVGPLVVDPGHVALHQEDNHVMKWLDTKETSSTVFVSFGSEFFLSSKDLEEIAYGLEMSNVNFIWVLRFPKSEEVGQLSQHLPSGFLERVKGRGLVIEGWAPQAKILGHKNTGGFVSHCGWSSVMEAMKFGVPIIAMPMQHDQPVNARLVVEVGVGAEVVRDGNGRLNREKVAAVVQRVVIEEVAKEKAKKVSVCIREKGDEEIDMVVSELLKLCQMSGGGRKMGRLPKTRSETFALDFHLAHPVSANRFVSRKFERARLKLKLGEPEQGKVLEIKSSPLKSPNSDSTPKFSIDLISNSMAKLPILQFEDKILETVDQNPVVVVIGETGSGKSTQLSQILHRSGYTKAGTIAVTQPRRVAAVSVSRRVAQELDVRLGEEVGYAIRFEDRTSERTCIKYLTDGVLLRESLSDPELKQYSVIILDEAHERSLNTDILMGLMKRLIRLRASNLKVLITSATLDGEKVSNFFSDCPILNVPGKLFPVEILYSAEQPKSYIESSLRKAIDIHVNEPEGDILIFMTGQDDIEKLVSKLEEKIQSLEVGSCMDALVLPLHGSLPPEMQVRVFSPPPPNCRRFIVATNIAETSLTVDGVVYVIDSGYVKQRQYNPSSGMYSLDVVQISRVQANQRAGRAGRTRPGKCYRLYPLAVYHDNLLEATMPEIQRSSLAGSVLYLKSLDLPDINILKFDFLDSPSLESLQDALKQLFLIDAIDENGTITRSGKTMAELPLEPSLARTLIEANEYDCLTQALTVAAMLSVEGTLLQGRSKSTGKKRKHPPSDIPDGSGWGDHIQLLQIYELWDQTDYSIDWCKDNNLQVRGMLFARDVRKQLSQIMQKIAKGSLDVKRKERRNDRQHDYKNLRKCLCVGYASQLAERMIRHNGYRTLGFKSQLVQVHPSSVLRTDDEGMLPNYVVYHELISTSRPFMRNVCEVEMQWVTPILQKLEKLNVNKLSGGSNQPMENTEENSNIPKKEVNGVGATDDSNSRIQAARDRFLARKANK